MPKKKKIIRKITFIFFAALLLLLAGISLLFSEQYIINNLKESFKQETGLELAISDLNLSILNCQVKIHDTSIFIPSQKEAISKIKNIQLSIDKNDIYDILINNKLHFHDVKAQGITIKNISGEFIKKFQKKAKTDKIKKLPHFITLLTNTQLDISHLTITKIAARNYHYQLNSILNGQLSGGGSLQGEIVDAELDNIKKITMTAKTQNFSLNIPSLNLSSDYYGEIKLRNNYCDFIGNLMLNYTPLRVLGAPDETMYSGTGTWNFIEDKLNFSDIIITNNQGLKLIAKGSINNPLNKEQRIINAQIGESTIPLTKINTGQKRLNIDFPNGFNFNGQVNIKPDNLNILGTADARGITISSKIDGKLLTGKISTEMQVTSNSLILANANCNIESLDIAGKIFIPFKAFKKEQFTAALKEIESNLSISGKISDLYTLLQPHTPILNANILFSGNFTSNLNLHPKPEETNSFNFNFDTDNNFSFTNTHTNRENNLNRFSAFFSGKITEKLDYQLTNLKVNSTPLLVDSQIKQNTDSDDYSLSLFMDADLKTLHPIIGNSLPKFFKPFSRFKINTQANINFATQRIKTKTNEIEFFFKDYSNPSSIIFTGNFELETQGKMAFNIPEATLNSISTTDSNQTFKSSSAIIQGHGILKKINAAQKFSFNPEGVLSAGIRSKNVAFLKLLTKALGHTPRNYNIKDSAIRTKINFNEEAVNCVATIKATELSLGKPVIFSEELLHADLTLKYDLSARKLIVEKFHAIDPQKSYQITASGSIYPDIMIFDEFHTKIIADLAKIDSKLQGYARSYQKYQGKIEFISELTGTASTPSLSIVGKSAKILISDNKFKLLALNPKFDAELEWSRDIKGRITNLKVKNIFASSNNGAFFISGVSDNLKLDKYGYVNFGRNSNFDFAFKGNKNLLWFISPKFSSLLKDKGNEKSVEISGNLQASKLPLLRFNKESEFDFFRSASINNGKLKIDSLTTHNITAANISADFSLHNNILKIDNGNTDISGKVKFISSIDFTNTPKGTIGINCKKIDLANIFSYITLKTPIINGWLNLPQSANDDKFTTISWTGNNLQEIVNSLKSKKNTANIIDLIIMTTIERQNWEELLSEDLPPSFAKEVAKRIDQKLSKNYGKKQKVHYKYFNLDYSILNRQLKIISLNCGGGNTADFYANGAIAFDGRIKLRLYPVQNIERSFNVNSLLDIPAIKEIIADLPPKSQNRVYQILPKHLEKLSRRKKLYIDIAGTIDKPILNFDNLKKELRRSLPEIIRQLKIILKNDNIISIFLGNTSKSLNNNPEAKKKFNDLTNMNLSDILQLID